VDKAIRMGVAGVGRIGKMHAEIISRKIPGLDLVAVADVNEAAANSVSKEFGVDARTVQDLISSPDIDAIAICTSTDTHVDLIEACAAAGKAIFCKKPISLDIEAVDRALANVEAAGVPFMVGFNRRFDPSHKSVRDAVLEGKVGDTHLARITSRDPSPPPIEYIKVSGGIFLDMMIHDFDMAAYTVGSPIVEVYAKGDVRVDPAIGEAGDIDTAVVVLTHADGTLTTIDNSREAKYGYDQRVEVFGSKGLAVSDNPMMHTGFTMNADGTQATPLPYFFLERYSNSYLHEWEAFRDYLQSGGVSPVTAQEARAPIAVALAANESFATGQPVKVK